MILAGNLLKYCTDKLKKERAINRVFTKEDSLRKLKGFRYLWILASLAAILTIAGCSGDSPLAPNTDQGQELGRVVLSELAAVASDVAVVATSDVAALTGGTIAISKKGYVHEFEVKAKALSRDVAIEVSVKEDIVNKKKAIVFEFGPDGLVFEKASQLKCDIGEISSKASSGKLYYFDPKARAWVFQGEAQVVGGKVQFDIYHFSKYAISD
jgi:hypothetical protein